MKLKDFKGLIKHNNIELISIENIHEDYYVAEFKKPDSLTWTPGEHAIFSFKNQNIKGKKWRAFSIASRPEEGVVRIGTRSGPEASAFKSKLIDMKPGDYIDMRGPFGWFKLQDELSSIVMIAGGIGITPIFAILKELEAVGNKRKVDIIYSTPGLSLFKDEINQIAQKDTNITIHFIDNKEETVDQIKNSSQVFGGNAWYYISGSPMMIRGVTSQLKSSGIKSRKIINDPFMGI